MPEDQTKKPDEEPGLGIHVDDYVTEWNKDEEDGQAGETEGAVVRRKARQALEDEQREYAEAHAALGDESR